MRTKNRITLALAFAASLLLPGSALAGSIFLTGHDPDFHAISPSGNVAGARKINQVAIDFVTDSAFNPFTAGGVNKFLFVQSTITPPGGHRDGVQGIIQSGYTAGTDFEHHDASTLLGELGQLGTKYNAVVVASDFGGILTSAELDILNAQSGAIIDFINDGGGLYAMAESNSQANLTTGSDRFGFLPFVVASTPANQVERGFQVTPFGQSLGLLDSDVNGNASHNVFDATFGLNVVDFDAQGRIMSLAGRGTVDPNTGVVPEPFAVTLLAIGLLVLGAVHHRRRLRLRA